MVTLVFAQGMMPLAIGLTVGLAASLTEGVISGVDRSFKLPNGRTVRQKPQRPSTPGVFCGESRGRAACLEARAERDRETALQAVRKKVPTLPASRRAGW